jgi:exodeoxyribonuclease-3
MKFVSWNVNGLRACLSKGFADAFRGFGADVVCLQETKMRQGQAELGPLLEGYHEYWNSAEKKGYSGTAVFTKAAPQSVSLGIGVPEHDREGRVIRLDFETFVLVNVYTPNSRDQLTRLDYRMQWEDDFLAFLLRVGRETGKPLVFCGDLNVAHEEIDIKNPKSNRRNAGFTDEERAKMTALLAAGFTDTYRHFHPGEAGAYTWWSYFARARERNIGWRIDYFVVSDALRPNVTDTAIYSAVMGSDHCPVGLTVEGL